MNVENIKLVLDNGIIFSYESDGNEKGKLQIKIANNYYDVKI